MSIGNKVEKYLKRIIVVGGFLGFFIGSLTLVERALAQSTEAAVVTDDTGRVVNIYDRGEERVIITKAETVREALKVANIEVNEKQDVVEPALDSELVASKYNVNIYRARPVTIVDGEVRQRVTTAHQTPERIAEAAGMTLYREDVVTTEVAGELLLHGADKVLKIDRATSLEFTLYGKKTEVRTRAATVGEFLKEKEISLGKSDTLSVPESTPITAGMSVELWREGKQTITVDEEVDFPVEQIQDANRPVGYRSVQTPGEKGARTVTYEIEMKNGQEVSRNEIASVVTREPKKQVEVVGVKASGNPLTRSMGVNHFTDSKGVVHRETYYNLPMGGVMQIAARQCGVAAIHSVRADGAKIDQDGYVIVAAHLGNYPRCSVVETSLGLGRVYDTGGFAARHPHGFDLATNW